MADDQLGLGMIPGTGFLAAAAPGAFDGWMLLLRNINGCCSIAI